jgi:uncharacterized protein YydD (DUF2326 family)
MNKYFFPNTIFKATNVFITDRSREEYIRKQTVVTDTTKISKQTVKTWQRHLESMHENRILEPF